MKVNLKQKKKNFTMISNKIAKDKELSLKAKGMSLIIAHFPDDWVFYEENMQQYTKDARTAISNALKELEKAGYLYRKQLREKGRFANKIWIFSDEGLSSDDIVELCTECRKTEVDYIEIGKTTTTNTHSKNTIEQNKKNSQKKGRKKKFYDFVNVLKEHAMQYPNLQIEFKNKIYNFVEIEGKLFLKYSDSDTVLPSVHAENLYQKMANSVEVKITRGVK